VVFDPAVRPLAWFSIRTCGLLRVSRSGRAAVRSFIEPAVAVPRAAWGRRYNVRRMLSDLARAVGAWAEGAGGLGVLVVAVLDSSILALPNASDALIMYLTIRQPGLWWYYAGMGTAGVVLGSWPLYAVAQRGGQAVARRLTRARTSGLLGWYDRSAFLGVAGPAFLPPPFPLKIFVLFAGAAAYPFWRVSAALALGRGTRHWLEAGLAVVYRDQATRALERHGGGLALAMMGVLTLLGLGLLVWHRRRAPA
jgi:membrane protein YqaA with SNARE-associated domain